MNFFSRLLAILAVVALSGAATASFAKDTTAAISAAVLKDWAAATMASETETAVGMYSDGALFYGSAPDLKIGAQGITSYFSALPKGGVKDVVFIDPNSARIADNVIIVGSFVDFHVDFTGTPNVLTFRIMLTLVQDDAGDWKIAAHHAAPRM